MAFATAELSTAIDMSEFEAEFRGEQYVLPASAIPVGAVAVRSSRCHSSSCCPELDEMINGVAQVTESAEPGPATYLPTSQLGSIGDELRAIY